MKKMNSYFLIILLVAFTGTSFSQIEITLRKSFIDSIKNRVSIDAEYYIVKMHAHPNPPSEDGDMHIAGYCSNIGLPLVSEVMNAKYEDDVVDTLRKFEGTDTPVHLNGAWRIWCEHSGNDKQEQGAAFPPITGTNPDHVFELHPVLMVNDQNLLPSLRAITGYKYKDAEKAFNRYAITTCRLEDRGDRVYMETKGVGYNYAEYWISILDTTGFVASDGRFVNCRVEDKDGRTVYNKMRMAFPEGSRAELKVKDLTYGEKMHVLGIPRVNLSLLSYRIKHAADKPYMLEWNLPVEMIVVADLDNQE